MNSSLSSQVYSLYFQPFTLFPSSFNQFAAVHFISQFKCKVILSFCIILHFPMTTWGNVKPCTRTHTLAHTHTGAYKDHLLSSLTRPTIVRSGDFITISVWKAPQIPLGQLLRRSAIKRYLFLVVCVCVCVYISIIFTVVFSFYLCVGVCVCVCTRR